MVTFVLNEGSVAFFTKKRTIIRGEITLKLLTSYHYLIYFWFKFAKFYRSFKKV